jgi:hypothetical protein
MDMLLDIVEAHVFDDESMHQSFRIEEKESIKRASNIFLEKIFTEYDVVEIKNKYKEEVDDRKEIENFSIKNIIH